MIFSRIKFEDKLFFTKHLAVMIKSGITVNESLQILIDQTESPAFKKILSDISKTVLNGQSLTKALARHENIFDSFYRGLIEVGEESGTLDKSLEFLNTQLRKEYILKKKVQNALLYPSIVLIVAALMGGFISLFILPQLVNFFEALDVELPLTTRVLLFVAETMQNYGIFIISGTVLLIVVLNRIAKLDSVKPIWHKAKLRIPVIGKLLTYYELARFTRNLGTMLQTGVPIKKSLEITHQTMTNFAYKSATKELLQSVIKGKELEKSLEGLDSNLFPTLTVKMVSVGEKSGELDETLLYLGDFYEDEVDNITQNIAPIMEPILLVIIGIIVGFIALAIISPIYELTGSIG